MVLLYFSYATGQLLLNITWKLKPVFLPKKTLSRIIIILYVNARPHATQLSKDTTPILPIVLIYHNEIPSAWISEISFKIPASNIRTKIPGSLFNYVICQTVQVTGWRVNLNSSTVYTQTSIDIAFSKVIHCIKIIIFTDIKTNI